MTSQPQSGEQMPLQNSSKEDDEMRTLINTANETKYTFALPFLLRNITVTDFPPVLYLKAAGEGLFLTLLICWIVTGIYAPETIDENPLKTRLGYNNLCVGWDVPPANYVAAILWIFVAYLALRFTAINAIRFHHEPNTYTMAKISNLAFFLGVCIFTLCLMIPPTYSVWYHTLPFIGYIVTRYMVVLSLCMEDPVGMDLKSKIFLVVYGFISAALPIIYLSEYAYYDAYGVKSPWPYQVTMALDYGWFLCLAVTAKCIPSNMVLKRNFELVHFSNNGSVRRTYRVVGESAVDEESAV